MNAVERAKLIGETYAVLLLEAHHRDSVETIHRCNSNAEPGRVCYSAQLPKSDECMRVAFDRHGQKLPEHPELDGTGRWAAKVIWDEALKHAKAVAIDAALRRTA